MSRSDVFAEALALSEKERLELAAELLASAGPPAGSLVEATPEFRAELGRRVAEVKSGNARLVPWPDAKAALLRGVADVRRAKKSRAAKPRPRPSR